MSQGNPGKHGGLWLEREELSCPEVRNRELPSLRSSGQEVPAVRRGDFCCGHRDAALEKIYENKIRNVVVAHRLSTARNEDEDSPVCFG